MNNTIENVYREVILFGHGGIIAVNDHFARNGCVVGLPDFDFIAEYSCHRSEHVPYDIRTVYIALIREDKGPFGSSYIKWKTITSMLFVDKNRDSSCSSTRLVAKYSVYRHSWFKPFYRLVVWAYNGGMRV